MNSKELTHISFPYENLNLHNKIIPLHFITNRENLNLRLL